MLRSAFPRFRPIALLLGMFGSLVATAALAQDAPDAPMTFRTAGTGGNCADCVWIAAEGRITEDTVERFERYLRELKRPLPDTVRLNSRGGLILPALTLGERFRAHGMTTTVEATNDLADMPYQQSTPGMCYSACAYAFLGGANRHLPERSQLGVHQHFIPSAEAKAAEQRFEARSDLSSDQLLTGVIAWYMSKMDVDPRLLLQASTTPSGEIYLPERAELREMNAITPQPGWSAWRLERIDDRLVYAQTFEYGRRKIRASLTCRDGGEFWLTMMTPFRRHGFSQAELNDEFKPNLAVGDVTRQLSGDRARVVRKDGMLIILAELEGSMVRGVAAGQRLRLNPRFTQAMFSGYLAVHGTLTPLPDPDDMASLIRRACPR
ncbi:hypothetical protein CKO28_04595 [Rhodovibrio sodomensis]|uniref:Uncharacterized protein n=1 Tax=Rhodovibrio sodomensis TaxID=1088 RepID=A0ABS1DBL3_9PROT|nr:hypothetical protein [Rhodovibrio sodomensis]MBK1667312.1 hypothetical protein [Rhodovibrio sodomensis]